MRTAVIRGRVAAAVLLATAGSAPAADLGAPALPTFAAEPPPPIATSPWTGLYVGTEVFGISGGKGVRGGFGGGGYAGYDHEFDNNWVIGIAGGVGYSPSVFSWAYRGFNYAEVDARVGYDMGRLMPFVTVGGVAARPNGRLVDGVGDSSAALNDVLNGDGAVRGFATFGAGVAYKLTPNTTVELAVQTYRGNGFVAP